MSDLELCYVFAGAALLFLIAWFLPRGKRRRKSDKAVTMSKDKADWLYDETDAFSDAAHLVATDSLVSADEIAEAFDRINRNGPVERTVERTVRSNNPNPDYAPPMGKPKEPLTPRQCPNCGAPVSGSVCEYCGSVFDKREKHEIIGQYHGKPAIMDGEGTVRRYNPEHGVWEYVSENPAKSVKTPYMPTKHER